MTYWLTPHRNPSVCPLLTANPWSTAKQINLIGIGKFAVLSSESSQKKYQTHWAIENKRASPCRRSVMFTSAVCLSVCLLRSPSIRWRPAANIRYHAVTRQIDPLWFISFISSNRPFHSFCASGSNNSIWRCRVGSSIDIYDSIVRIVHLYTECGRVFQLIPGPLRRLTKHAHKAFSSLLG